ncbi:hypothetical protein [Halosimplex amylolyticum]|uniref:hypothetical protein n=1 Tax=Halosimplex amylolyticum TaxID=3396616 RepID=UPI003F56794F
MAPDIRRLLADWEFWHALTMVSLAVWILARTSRYALIDGLYALIWNGHGAVPFVSRVERDQIRLLVEVFVGLWLPIAIVSFVCGFFVFHAGAESRRQAEGE